MSEKKRKPGRPKEKENRVKIGLSIDAESKKLLDMLAAGSNKTKSKIFEEALLVLKDREDVIAERIDMINELGDDAFIDMDALRTKREELKKKKEEEK